MKTLIIDDEPLARRELRRLLAGFGWIEITGEAANVAEGIERVHALAPDLVFLDVQMPGGTGFDLLEQIDVTPLVIFTTAYDHHAVRAFEVNALDYLVKPIEPDRLERALARVRTRSAASSKTPNPHLEQLFVRDGPRCWFVPLREVSLLTSDGNYVRLLWGKAQPLLGRSLINLEQYLDPKKFFRANRQQIVNLDFVTEVDLGVSGRLHVQLRDGPEVEISRRQAKLFKMRTSI